MQLLREGILLKRARQYCRSSVQHQSASVSRHIKGILLGSMEWFMQMHRRLEQLIKCISGIPPIYPFNLFEIAI
jgi:hypothetical protein